MADRRMFSRDIFKSSVMVNLGYKNAALGLESQRVFETLIILADDWGRGRLIPEIIRGEAFMSTPEAFARVTPEMIREWIEQIHTDGALVIYNTNGQEYYFLTGWDRYQRGGWQKGKSLLPDPPGFVSDDPLTDGGQAADTGATTDERKGKERKRKEKKENKTAASASEAFPSEYIDFVREIIPRKLNESELYKQTEALDKLIRIDMEKCTFPTGTFHDAEVFEILIWARQDDFWRGNFNSITRLRRNGSEKFWNMRSSWLKSKDKGRCKMPPTEF